MLRYERRCDNADGATTGGAGDDGDGSVYVERFDVGGELLAPKIMPDGTMLVEARIAKPGILRYVDAAGNVTRELLSAEELHRADSLATLGRVPVTLEHPRDDEGVILFVSPDNVDRFGVGDVDGAVEIDADGFVRIKMAIRRRDAIEAVERGKQEMSPGYKMIIDPTSGEHPEFGSFDAIQRGRIYNHAAITDVARGGPKIRLRADGAARQLPATTTTPTPDKGGNVNPILIALLASLGVERPERFDSDEAGLTEVRRRVDAMIAARTDAGKNATEMQRLTDANAALQTALDAEKAKFATLKGVADALQAKADAADAEAQTKADAAEREQLTALAGRYDGAEALAGVDPAKAELPALRKAIATAHLDSLGVKLDAEAADAEDGARYIAGILTTIPAKRGDEANPWKGLGTGSQAGDGERHDGGTGGGGTGGGGGGTGGDAPPKTPSQAYFERADAHFKAAKTANRTGGAA
jgi:hypothetical protein